MSIAWQPCAPEETARVLDLLHPEVEWEIEMPGLIERIQGIAMSEGYRLVNPRFGCKGQQARSLVVDSVEHMVAD